MNVLQPLIHLLDYYQDNLKCSLGTFTIVYKVVTNVELVNLYVTLNFPWINSPRQVLFLNSEYIVYLCTSTFLHGIENILGDFMASS